MVRIEVLRGDLLMALSASVHDHELEPLRVRPADRVRAVAIGADRQLLRCGSHFRRVHALLELILNPDVAGSARRGDVVAVDAGSRAVRREHAVRGMAARAHGADDEAASNEPLAVDALLIMLDDVGLRARVTHRGLLPRAVTARAQGRDVQREGGRRRVLPREDVVRAVTLRARRGVPVLLRLQLAVRAGAVLLRNVGMAGGALDLGHADSRGPRVRRIDRGVALAARDLRMHRTRDRAGLDRERVTVHGRFDVGTSVATQAARSIPVPAVRVAARLVRRMAAHARGNRGAALRPSLDGNDLAVHLFELRVAPHAGGRQVLPRDRRTIVGRWQDVVCRVARRAGRRDDQPLLCELPVNEVGIIRGCVGLPKLTLPVDRLARRVARSTHGGDTSGKHGRAGIVHRHDARGCHGSRHSAAQLLRRARTPCRAVTAHTAALPRRDT